MLSTGDMNSWKALLQQLFQALVNEGLDGFDENTTMLLKSIEKACFPLRSKIQILHKWAEGEEKKKKKKRPSPTKSNKTSNTINDSPAAKKTKVVPTSVATPAAKKTKFTIDLEYLPPYLHGAVQNLFELSLKNKEWTLASNIQLAALGDTESMPPPMKVAVARNGMNSSSRAVSPLVSIPGIVTATTPPDDAKVTPADSHLPNADGIQPSDNTSSTKDYTPLPMDDDGKHQFDDAFIASLAKSENPSLPSEVDNMSVGNMSNFSHFSQFTHLTGMSQMTGSGNEERTDTLHEEKIS